MTTVTVGRQRRLVRVTGVVQGVGFRPFVHSLARRFDLTGHVGNDAEGVFVDVTGSAQAIEQLCRALVDEAPPLAVVESVVSREVALEPAVPQGFQIVESVPASLTSGAATRRPTLVPPDVATCRACLAELADPADRRYRHPFITCTHCGPRFTIVTGLPYDRPMTTMAGFPLCPDCSREYHDPTDRRFHAQPVSCHACGPRLELVGSEAAHGGAEGPLLREQALARARQLLAQGRIVAVKGIGGYHLACDAGDEAAVQRLRRRKQRGDKPFAVLVRDVAAARRIARVDDTEAALLASPRCPIVLLRRLPAAAGEVSVAQAVAPGTGQLGLMLPPSALHLLLLGEDGSQALVLTSGNLAGEPIVTDDAEALTRLGGIADAWLRHDRPIHIPCDDSVSCVVDGFEVPIRRSRGYAPMPIDLPVEIEAALATGGDLKNTVAVGQGRRAWLSGHIGDLDDLVTQRTLQQAVTHLQALVEIEPTVVVADRHPRYRSTAWARAEARRRAGDGAGEPVLVQHHHAHVAAVMAEHGLTGEQPVLGFAFDGTGYGEDGAVWGGEGLVVGGAEGYRAMHRAVHLAYVPLAGGDASVERVYRMALSHLWAAGLDWDERLPAVAACPAAERPVLHRQLETGLACVPTSSMGRLFDAVAALAGVCQVAGYEAQAAVQLQARAEDQLDDELAGIVEARPGYPLPLFPAEPTADLQAAGEPAQWDVGVLVRAVGADVLAEVSPGAVALSFHRGIAEAVATAAVALAPDRLSPVVLGGGVFANTLLLRLSSQALRRNGFVVLRPHLLPPNDGGLAIGQLVVGAARPPVIEGSTPCA